MGGSSRCLPTTCPPHAYSCVPVAARSRAPFGIGTRLCAAKDGGKDGGKGDEEEAEGEGAVDGVGGEAGEREVETSWAGGDELQIMVMRNKLERQFMRARIKAKVLTCVRGVGGE